MKELNIFRYFLGEFSGEGNSEWGYCNKRSTYTYPFNLSGNFIKLEWELSYPRQEKNPLGDFVRGVGFINFDKVKKNFVLTLFMSEGYIEKYIGNYNPLNNEFEFELKDSANLPETIEAKLTIKILDDDEFEEIYSWRMNKEEDYKTYLKVHNRRIR